MAEKEYFIMMNNQDGSTILPIINDAENVKFFSTHAAAEKLAMDHSFCRAFGYEIFCRGEGVWE